MRNEIEWGEFSEEMIDQLQTVLFEQLEQVQRQGGATLEEYREMNEGFISSVQAQLGEAAIRIAGEDEVLLAQVHREFSDLVEEFRKRLERPFNANTAEVVEFKK